MHIGVILPTFGERVSPARVCEVAQSAEELGFDSVWTTEHLIVGPEAADPYGQILDPLCTLSWIAGFTKRVGLGTSIVLLPLHHPIHLAKEAATLQVLSEGRLRLGIGVGWHKPEFDFMSVDFHDRGHRADESLRLMAAVWRGARSFRGENWSFDDASFGPLPTPVPEIWIGGNADVALKRALRFGDVWHPTARPAVMKGPDRAQVRWVGPDDVRRAKEASPELRIIPRVSGLAFEETLQTIDSFQQAGADGAVVSFGTDGKNIIACMQRFSKHRAS